MPSGGLGGNRPSPLIAPLGPTTFAPGGEERLLCRAWAARAGRRAEWEQRARVQLGLGNMAGMSRGRACASAVWESQADTYYKDTKEEGDGGDAEGETGTS